MRLIPQSLFARLALILIGGLVFAQLLSFALIHRERGESQRLAHLQQRLARVVAVTEHLDQQSAADRPHSLALLAAAGIPVTLHPAHSPTRARLPTFIAKDLRASLGPHRQWWLAPADRTDRGPPGPPFAIEAQLRDGQWARFTPPPVRAPGDWPERLRIHLLTTVLAVLLVSVLAVRWTTRPLKQLADAAASLAQDLNRPPLPEDGPREARQAAQAFNQMQQALGRLINERTKALSAMSHDLRTPLTRLRLRLELLDDDALRQKMAADLQEMQQLTETTLDYLRGLSSNEALRPVDVDSLVDSLLADLQDSHGVTVGRQGHALAPLPARPQALRRALMNLLDNAVNYGTQVEIQLEDSQTLLRLQVRDRGPGIPDAELDRMLEPFQRLEDSRNRDSGGVGLGLTIVRDIAALHGGRLLLANRPGGGLQATLELPRPPAADYRA